jgi:hypothetical protein
VSNAVVAVTSVCLWGRLGCRVGRVFGGVGVGGAMSGKLCLCWLCNKKLVPGFVEINFNGSTLRVHKVCRVDAENLVFRKRLTFAGESIEPAARRKQEFYEVNR